MECGRGLEVVINLSKNDGLYLRSLILQLLTDLVGLISVLVVGGRDIFSAVDAHIFPCFIQTVLEDVD